MSALCVTAGWADTLSGAMVEAYRTSDLLDQNRALLRSADEDVAQAVSGLRPVIDYVANFTYSDSSNFDNDTSASAGLEASLLLFDFGQTQLTIDLQKETVLALRQALRGIEQDVLLRAVAAYLDVRLQIAFVNLRENNVRVIGQQLQAARDRFEVGEVTRTDVSIAEARLATARSSLAAAQGSLARAREEYNAVVGSYPGALNPPPAPPAIPASEQAAKAVARERHPDILEQRHRVMAAELGVAVAETRLYPRLNGTAGVTVNDEGNESGSVGINLRGPIYRGGNLSSVIRQAQAQRDASRSGLYIVVDRIEQSVGNAWADLAVAIASQRASEEGVRSARLALRGAQEEQQVGARTVLDVLDLEQDLLDVQTTLVSAQTDRLLAVYALLSSMGLLTVEHLGLNVPTYDPSAYYNAVRNAPVRDVSPQGEQLDRILKRLNRN